MVREFKPGENVIVLLLIHCYPLQESLGFSPFEHFVLNTTSEVTFESKMPL